MWNVSGGQHLGLLVTLPFDYANNVATNDFKCSRHHLIFPTSPVELQMLFAQENNFPILIFSSYWGLMNTAFVCIRLLAISGISITEKRAVQLQPKLNIIVWAANRQKIITKIVARQVM